MRASLTLCRSLTLSPWTLGIITADVPVSPVAAFDLDFLQLVSTTSKRRLILTLFAFCCQLKQRSGLFTAGARLQFLQLECDMKHRTKLKSHETIFTSVSRRSQTGNIHSQINRNTINNAGVACVPALYWLITPEWVTILQFVRYHFI